MYESDSQRSEAPRRFGEGRPESEWEVIMQKAKQTRGKGALRLKRATVKDLRPRSGAVQGGLKVNTKA